MKKQLILFNDSEIDSEIQKYMLEMADAVKQMPRKSATEALRLGQRLLEIKNSLKGTHWLRWIEDFSRMSHDTVHRYIQIAEIDFWQSLDFNELNQFDKSALYCLSSRQATNKHRVIALEELKRHQKENPKSRISHQMAVKIINGTVEVELEGKFQDIGEVNDKKTFATEKDLVEYLKKKFFRTRPGFQAEVRYPAGDIDLLTNDEIVEVKNKARRDEFFKAVGQILLYNESLEDKKRKLIIACTFSEDLRPLVKMAEKLGIQVWDCGLSEEDLGQLMLDFQD